MRSPFGFSKASVKTRPFNRYTGRNSMFHGLLHRSTEIIDHMNGDSGWTPGADTGVLIIELGTQITDVVGGSVAEIISDTRDLTNIETVRVTLNVISIDAGTSVELEVTDGTTTVTDSTTAGATGAFVLEVDTSAINAGATITVRTTAASTLDAVISPILGIL